MLNLLLYLGARVMAFNTPDELQAHSLWLISAIMLALRPQSLGQFALREPFPSLDASECDRCPPNVELAAEAYLSPPASESCDFIPSVVESHTSQDLNSLPLPLNPVSLPTSNSNAVTNQVDTPRIPGRRRHSTRNYLTPPVTPDRYISNRFSPQETSKSFRLSKSPHQLSSSERLLRYTSATPDPFGPLLVQRRREARDTTLVDRDVLAMRFRNRTMGITYVLALPQDTLALQTGKPVREQFGTLEAVLQPLTLVLFVVVPMGEEAFSVVGPTPQCLHRISLMTTFLITVWSGWKVGLLLPWILT